MIVGRSTECREILRLRESAESGRGAARVLTGAPGVGKTELLRWAAEHPGTARVVEVEALKRDRDQSLALHRAIVDALGTGLDRARSESSVEPDVGAALVSVLADAARAQPLLLLVDGAEWADGPSRDAVAFAAPRLDRESVLMLIAERDCDVHGFAARVPTIEIAGLSPLDAAVLLGSEVDTRVAEKLGHETDGNPLALLEIAARLSPEQRRGARPLGPDLPIGEGVRRAFLARRVALGPTELRALLLASTDCQLDRAMLLEAADACGIDAETVARIVIPGILHVERSGIIRFAHPLLRVAVYQSADASDRRSAHRMVAAALGDRIDMDRRSRHLAAGADGPDELASDALAAAAQSRAGGVDAGEVWYRSAVLTPDLALRYERLLAAGVAFARADEELRAVHAFDEALEIVDDVDRRCDAVMFRAMPAVESLGTRGIRRELDALTDQLDPSDPRVRVLVGLSGTIALLEGDLVGAREVLRSEASATPGPTQTMLAVARLLTGEISEVGDVVAYGQQLAASGDARFRHEEFVVFALTWAGEHSAASRLVDALVTVRRSTGARVELAFALTARAHLYSRTGHWGAAHVDAVEAVELAGEASRPTTLARSLFVLARVEAGLGETVVAIEHARASFDLSERFGLGAFSWHAAAAMGFALLGNGHPTEAIEWLERARRFERTNEVRLLTVSLAAPDLVEAYVRCGGKDGAAQLVNELASDHPERQGALGEALFLRCRALVDGTDARSDFEASLERHADVRAPFEEARTRLCFGERLRRDRDVAAAHRNLAAAAEAFDRIGARDWARRAQMEAAACTRGHATSASASRSDVLTPQEHRVAIVVANGATSREAAAALFLSPRTVEYHLGKIYRKLGLRSRSDLARRIAGDPGFAAHGDLRR